MLVLEVAPVTGHNLYVFLIPVLIASAAGLLMFDAILEIDLPSYTASSWRTCSRRSPWQPWQP